MGGDHVGHQASGGPQSNALSRPNCALRGARSYRLAGSRKARAELSGPNYPGRIIRAERPRAELSGPKDRKNSWFSPGIFPLPKEPANTESGEEVTRN